MTRLLLTILLLLLFCTSTPVTAGSSVLTENWLSNEYKRFRIFPRLDRAYKLIKQKEYNEAIPLLRKVIQIDPDNDEANKVLLQVCLETQQYDCVTLQADKWKKTTTDNPVADYYSAIAYHESGQLTKAVKHAKTAYQNTILSVERRILIGRLLIDDLILLGEIQEAIVWGRRTQRETPFISQTDVLNWANQLVERGFYSDADFLYSRLPSNGLAIKHRVALFEKWGKNTEAALLLESLAATANKNKPEYWLQLAYLYQKANQIDDEFRTLREGIAAADSNQILYKALINRLIKLNQLTEAAALTEEALKKYNTPELRNQLTKLLGATEQYDQALEQVQLLMGQTEGDSNTIRQQLIFLLTKTGRWSELAELKAENFYQDGNYQDLLSALYSYELDGNDLQRRKLLEANVPFKNTPPVHRDYLTLELLDLYRTEQQFDKSIQLVKTLVEKKLLSQSLADKLLNRAQAAGRCDLAVPFAERLMQQKSATGRTYLVTGYCLENSKPGIALDYLLEANRRDILPSEQSTLNRSLGYLYSETGNNSEALAAWKRYLQNENNDIDTSLSALILALAEQDQDFVQTLFTRLENKPKLPKQMADYLFALGIQAYQQDSFVHAKILYEASLLLQERVELYHLLANTERQLNNNDAALAALDNALRLAPENSVILAERGYLKANKGNSEGAVQDFTQSYNLVPNRTSLLAEIAYEQLKTGNRKGALPWLYKAIDEAASYPNREENEKTVEETLYDLRRTVQTIEDQWNFNMTAFVRLDEYEQTSLLVPPVAYAGYGGLYSGEVSYKIEEFSGVAQDLNGRIQLFGRFLQGMKDQSLETTSETLQWGLGVRYKLLADQNLHFSAERIIGTGDEIEDEWMFRLSGSFSEGGDWEPSKKNWLYWEAYGDLAYTSDDDFLYKTAHLNLGRQIKLSQNNEHKYTIVPYITSGYTSNNANDERKHVERLDLGVGLGLFSWHHESHYRASTIHSKLRLEARNKIGGNTKDDQTVRLIYEFFF